MDEVAPSPTVDERIASSAASLAKALLAMAHQVGHEDELKVEAARHLEAFIEDAGLQIKARHEYGLAGGRIDSKYGGVILEYKNPNGASSLGVDSGARKAIKQVESRFEDFKKDEGISPDRLFGVTLDGQRILYITHDGNDFSVSDLCEITAETVSPVFRALVSIGARGVSFTPENLVRDFGAKSSIAIECVRQFYETIVGAKSPKAETLFGQWALMFSEVCGYNLNSSNEHLKQLGKNYGIVSPKAKYLLFALHTYYALSIKFLATEICSALSPIPVSLLRRCHSTPTSVALATELTELEAGGIWAQLGITNFMEGDIFSWYLAEWSDKVNLSVRKVLNGLVSYDLTTLSVDPGQSRDLLKKLYQNLVSKEVRHDLGEYYTADWLAEYTLDQAGYAGDPNKRVLDPACGSGTFLVAAINRARRWFHANRFKCGFDEAGLVKLITRNIVGFDLNPLAVMAARVNYLLALGSLIRHSSGVDVPVYLCDSVLAPTVHGSLWTGKLGNAYRLKTHVGELIIPSEAASDAPTLSAYSDELERAVHHSYSFDEFTSRCKSRGIAFTSDAMHRTLLKKLSDLQAVGKNSIWPRIIRNAFAPLFLHRVDFVLGNPPWVNWESLPDDYRDDQKPLWVRYGLFTLSGAKARLGGGKKDLSMLFAYVCADRYLVDNGKLGFVITQTVFKTKGAGDGFRWFRFKDGNKYIYVAPQKVFDLSSMQVFDGATNRTSVLIAQRSAKAFQYPIPYDCWTGPGRIPEEETLKHVLGKVKISAISAAPVQTNSPGSPWLTAHHAAIPAIRKVVGKTMAFHAYEGVNAGGLSGCFWIKVIAKAPGGNLIENMHDAGKKKVKKIKPTVVESDRVYPLIRGRDVRKWSATASAHQIISQDPDTRRPIPLSTMKVKFPLTFAYLKQFEKPLLARSSTSVKKLMTGGTFYAMFSVSNHTFAEHKVMWPELNDTIEAAVVSAKGRVPFPDHTVVFVPCEDEDVANYVCAVVNSTPFRAAVRGYVAMHPSPHVLDMLMIPSNMSNKKVANKLAALSAKAHSTSDTKVLASLQRKIDISAAALYGITYVEMKGLLRNSNL